MKKILPVILLLCVLAAAVGFGVYYHIQTQTKFNDGYVNGNNAGNLYNAGLFCESDGTVFFANPSDEYRLYAMDSDGSNLRKISNDIASFINADDNYIYYVRNNTSIDTAFSFLSILVNAFPAYLAYKTVGKKFTVFSCLCILVMSFLTDLIPSYALTYDPLLITVFGGIINGAAVSLILNAGASSGGTDFVAMYFSVRKGISTWNYVLMFNAVIILISGILFGLDSALYTIIFQFCQTQVLNLLYRRYDKKTVFIITDKPQEIADRIMEMTHHSATMFKAEGAYTHKPHYVVYSILPAEDVQKVRRYARSIDAHAFINVMKSEGVTGNFYMRPIS